MGAMTGMAHTGLGRGRRAGALSMFCVITAEVLAACSANTSTAIPTEQPKATSTVWLCRPGTLPDPCAGNLDWRSVSSTGASTSHIAASAADPAADCFYVYPTVSSEPTANADLKVQPAEISVAIDQAARFSTVCRVWAPMYRQETMSSLGQRLQGIHSGSVQVAYDSLLSAWGDYLAHDNYGRPVVLIGHSQGSVMLIKLLQSQFDDDPGRRAQLVSALLLGGNVTVSTGSDEGGTFAHIPTCATASSTGCVVAYSSFLQAPPANSLFGIPGQGVSLQEGAPQRAGLQVACTDPTDPTAGSGALDPFFAVLKGTTVRWYEFPGLYSGQCTTVGDATWLQVDDVSTPTDPRVTVKQTAGPLWGLHGEDVNIALGNLVALVGGQIAAYGQSGG